MKKALEAVILSFLLITSALAVVMIDAITITTTSTAQVVDMTNRKYPATVTIYPQSGVVGTAEFSTTYDAANTPSTANWQVLGTASNVSTPQTITLSSPVTAVRFTRISGASAVIGEINWPR